MGLGESAGRSEGNKTNGSAPRRATQRERAGIDPPFPESKPEPRYRLTARGVAVRDFLLALLALLAYGSFVAFCCLGAIIFAAWWGLL